MVSMACATAQCGDEGAGKDASIKLPPANEVEPRGTKLSPICNDETMKKEATSTEELKKQCFPNTFTRMGSQVEKSKAINSTVAERTTSREGRSTQRWLMDPSSTKVTRLVTGCVPILPQGKIMLASASKKSSWILPKGGWETDEEMEESAIRETFEEAGVIGVLGAPLSTVEYEARKSKERKLHGNQKADATAESTMIYSHVRVTLYPLYVTEVMSTWPESGRLRRSVDIEEAIELLAPRPEQQSILREVKAKGLHRV